MKYFISYHRRDQPTAAGLAAHLRAQGHDVWWYAADADAADADAADAALREADAVVVLLSDEWAQTPEAAHVRAVSALAPWVLRYVAPRGAGRATFDGSSVWLYDDGSIESLAGVLAAAYFGGKKEGEA